jgi:uncharacterized Zn finger protein
MTVTPIPNEPGRFHVTSETDDLPWLVDLKSPYGEPKCACAIEHNRTERHWSCKHIRAVIAYLKNEKLSQVPH